MLTSYFSRVGLSCAFAAVLAVAAPGVQTASAAASSPSTPATRLLNSKLPQGVTLPSADGAQTYDALKAAAAEQPEMASRLLRAAIAARQAKSSRFPLDCALLTKLVDAAAAAAPDKVRQFSEEALATSPECADTLNTYLTGVNQPGVGGGVSGEGGEGGEGTGAGFGPGFPGSPGFVGSAPGGTIALPPVGVAVTSSVNG